MKILENFIHNINVHIMALDYQTKDEILSQFPSFLVTTKYISILTSDFRPNLLSIFGFS